MPVRRLALACLAACTPTAPPTPAVASPAASPVLSSPVTPPPVPTDSPQPTPPRSLHPQVRAFTLLGDALLISPRTGPDLRLDPITGNTTTWSISWSPTAAGWRLADPAFETSCGPPQARPDGRWIAVACMFEARPAPRSGLLTSAILVVRPDGSEPRCVGVGLTTDEFPPFTWLSDRLLGDWTAACTPGPGGRLKTLADNPRSPATRWWNPDDESRGLHTFRPDFTDRDPLGELALVRFHDDRTRAHGLHLVDLRGGAVVRTLPEVDDHLQWFAGFVAADAVLVNTHVQHKFASQRLEFADGRSTPPPEPTWRHFARLPNDEHLFTRDRGATVEQGRVDWPNFKVLASRPRPDLLPHIPAFDRTSYTTFTPGLGGLLILDPPAGTLLLADL